MNYFKKTKFRETSLIFVVIFIAIIYFTISDSSEEDELDVQALIDAAVEEAVEEALSNTSDEYTDKTDGSTATTYPGLAVPVDKYWGQYDDGRWAIVLSSEKPENFEWAWDIFNREDPSGAYGFDEFHENSTLIGTLVDFDCSFNRISKTEEHKEAFGVFETTIEYYDTYFDWAVDNYDYLTEEAVITISKIMRGVWTCDYEYLESISTEYLDFYVSGDVYPELPSFSKYIANNEDIGGKYTYTLGALLYMTPEEYLSPIGLLDLCPSRIQWIGDKWYQWPLESMNPKQLNEIQIARMSMFDNGITKSLIDGTYQGDDGTYGFRLQITTEGIWKAYKYSGHPWSSGYEETLPYHVCPESESDSAEAQEIPDSAVPGRKIEGEVTTFGQSYDQSLYSKIKSVRIATGISETNDATYDAFIIQVEKTKDYDLLPGPYLVWKGGNPCITDENGCKVPDDFEEYLWIRGAFSGYGWTAPEQITNEDSKLVGKYYGTFEGESDFLLKIEPGASFRSYRLDDLIVIEVEKITPLTFTRIEKTFPSQIYKGKVESRRQIVSDSSEYEILIDDKIYAKITPDTVIFFNGILVDGYSFKGDGSEYVHAVFYDSVLESSPAQGTASVIYIKNRFTSGFVNTAILNDIEYHQNDRVRGLLVDEEMFVSITENTEIYLNGIKVDSYNFNSEKSEYVYVKHGVVFMSYRGETTAEAIYIVTNYIVND